MDYSEDQELIKEFTDGANLCVCGRVDDVLELIFVLLQDFYDGQQERHYVPLKDASSLFLWWTLDSWGLVTHHGSVDAGMTDTERGKLLYEAMRRLKDTGQFFIPD